MTYHDECRMLNTINDLIICVRSHIAKTEELNNKLETMLDQHQRVIYGNGELGLKTRVAILEDGAMKRSAFGLVAVGALLTSIGSIIMNFFPIGSKN